MKQIMEILLLFSILLFYPLITFLSSSFPHEREKLRKRETMKERNYERGGKIREARNEIKSDGEGKRDQKQITIKWMSGELVRSWGRILGWMEERMDERMDGWFVRLFRCLFLCVTWTLCWLFDSRMKEECDVWRKVQSTRWGGCLLSLSLSSFTPELTVTGFSLSLSFPFSHTFTLRSVSKWNQCKCPLSFQLPARTCFLLASPLSLSLPSPSCSALNCRQREKVMRQGGESDGLWRERISETCETGKKGWKDYETEIERRKK